MQLILTQLLLCCIPILSLAISGAIFSIALHSSNHRHRLRLLPLFVAFSVHSFTTSKHFWYFSPSLVSLWSLGVALYIPHIVSLLYIEKWPAPPSRSAQQGTNSIRLWQKLDWKATYKLWGNPQLLSTTKGSSQNSNDSLDSTPEIPHSVFFLRLVKLPIYYCLHTYVIPTIFSETIYAFFLEDVSPIQQTLIRRLSDVTAREIVIRSYTSIIWILESLIFLDSANAVLACFFVLVDLDQPSEWPALFGDITSATSLRRFWARFWHRLAVRPYSNYGKALAHGLRLKPGSFTFKTVVACVVFLLSGVTHSAVSWRVGQRVWYLDIWWFFLNFLGCLLEIICLTVIRSLERATRWSEELKMIEESWFGKFVGYTWVFGFSFGVLLNGDTQTLIDRLLRRGCGNREFYFLS